MHFEARGRFAVRPDQLWPLVSDTQRLNRALGLPPMKFRTEPLATGGSRVIGEYALGPAALSLLGQLLPVDPARLMDERLLRRLPQVPLARWSEHPFEWQETRRYEVVRDYFWNRLGLFAFRQFRGGAELLPTDDGGTEVIAFAHIVPWNPQGALLTRLVLGPKGVQGLIRQCRYFEQYLLGWIDDPFPQLSPAAGDQAQSGRQTEPPPAAEGARRAEDSDGTGPGAATVSAPASAPSVPSIPSAPSVGVAAGWAALVQAGVRPRLIDRLRAHLAEAPDEAVLKMRPFELADRWGEDRRETLAMFLHATTAGPLEMSWDVLCPNCRIAKAEYSSLADLKDQAHCDFCNITYDATFDRQVEVRFSASPTIRQVADRRFCSGGPMNTPHVLVQSTLEPGEVKEMLLTLPTGAFRLRSLQSKATGVLDVGAGSEDQGAFTIAADSIRPPAALTASGNVHLRLQNGTGVQATVSLERPDWPDTAATAALVSTMQEFRDLFGSEVLAPGLQLAIQRLGFLFTDLAGSTAMYQAVGQARAFRLVEDHFELLRPIIQEHRGAMIKTIGDAIMATFPTGADAFAAALAMQRGVRQLDTAGAADTTRFIKIGVHEGPCIAVNANGSLDYFGTTVNVAARVQSEAHGGEVVLTDDVYQEPAVQERIRRDGLLLEPAETHLRGIREPVRLYHIPNPVPVA